MNNRMKQIGRVNALMFAALMLLLSVDLIGCDAFSDAKNNFDSKNTCEDYCSKKFDCADHNPTGDESDSCVSSCRNSMEDNCGNDNQADANDQINACVDKNCADFGSCMVFEAAPECFGFAN